MKGKRPFTSRLKRAFVAVTAALTIGAGTGGIELLPKDPVTDTQKITTINKGTPEQRGVNISLVDHFWKSTLDNKSQAELFEQLSDNAASGDSWRVRAILEEEKTDAAASGRIAAQEAMNTAALHGHTDVMKVMYEFGVEANGGTFLSALRGQHYALAQELIGQVELSRHTLDEGLKIAAYHGHGGFVTDLLSRGADPGADDSYALRVAVAGGHLAIAQQLLDEKRTLTFAYTYPENYFGYGYGHHFDPFSYPVYHEDYFKGIPYDYNDYDRPFDNYYPGQVPPYIERAPMQYMTTTVQAVDVNALDGQALTTAVSRGDVAMTQLLLSHGADINAGNGAALTAAVLSGDAHMVALLVEKKADTKLGSARDLAAMSGNTLLTDALDGKPIPPKPPANTLFFPLSPLGGM